MKHDPFLFSVIGSLCLDHRLLWASAHSYIVEIDMLLLLCFVEVHLCPGKAKAHLFMSWRFSATLACNNRPRPSLPQIPVLN